MFIDKAKIFVQAGNGGNGCVSFRREKFIPRGGPDGGDGGKGGDVVLVAYPGIKTLLDFYRQPHYRAQNGAHGSGNNRSGKAESLKNRFSSVTVSMGRWQSGQGSPAWASPT